MASPSTGAADGTNGEKTPLWILCAPGLFVLLWASGFPITKLGLEYAPPFMILAIRSVINVALMLVVICFVRSHWPRTWRDAGHIAVSGFLLQFAYLSTVFISLGEGVSQGVIALIAGMQPLLTAAVAGRLLGERVSLRQWAGFVLGFAGLGLVMSERITLGTATVFGFVIVAFAPVLITAGSLYQKRFCAHMDLRTGMIIQHSVAGVASFTMASFWETRPVDWSPELAFVLVWLVLLLSVGATNLYFILLRRGQAARVSSLFFLTPPTAAVMGYFTYGEVFGVIAMVGFVVAVCGVALVTVPVRVTGRAEGSG